MGAWSWHLRAGDGAVTPRSTTYAYGPDGRTIHFADLVRDGEIVEVDGRRMIVRYDPLAPDWFANATKCERRESC